MLDAILAQSRNTALIMGLIAMIGLLLRKARNGCDQRYDENSYRIYGLQHWIFSNVRCCRHLQICSM